MLTCKTAYLSSTDLIAQHNEHRRLFRHIKIRAPYTDTAYLIQTLVDYTLGIAAHPEIARYARTLTVAQDGEQKSLELDEIGDNRDAPRYTNAGLEWIRKQDSGRTRSAGAGLLFEAVVDSPWFRAAGVDTTAWFGRVRQFKSLVGIDDGSQSQRDYSMSDDASWEERDMMKAEMEVAVMQLVVLLFTQLDKLQTLILRRKADLSADPGIASDQLRDSQRVLELMVARIEDDDISRTMGSHKLAEAGHITEDVTTSHTKASVLALRACGHLTSPLNNLREVRTDIEKRPENFMATRALDAVFASSRVRNVFATCLIADEEEPAGEYHGPSPSSALLKSVQPYSGIERLELYGSALGPAGIAGLVHRMPFLKVLRCMHEPKTTGFYGSAAAGSEWDLDGFLKAVATARPVMPYASPVPQTLGDSITDLGIALPLENYPYTTAVWSLHNFTALKRLEVGAWVFIGPNPASGERLGHLKPSPPRPGFEKWDRKKDGQIPKLVDVLPPSIEEVFIELEGHCDIWRRLFQGFAAERAEKLPSLKRCAVWGDLENFDYRTDTQEGYNLRETAAIAELEGQGVEYMKDGPHQHFWITEFENRAIEDPLSH
ncbi:uncharacterized protein B0I36DRAFT_326409 [Microdochium trichocladiopsis]|uniref:Uncharacterized protein n=1 Tax=Microdochium trichocladiopsis TaxID=1682393 RepID=A0A9P8Y7J3_9PEZI|nr:uncharacterized protein B0I36DRAFT_326409 [Microdochium trichocladiopsis]KAH7029833.1 hypothetical protein B0I36DRAFT_326409 [Microdochium trichocladiopsis]